MSAQKRMVLTPDGPKEGVQVSVEESHEELNTYRLSDGNTIRLKTVVLDVVQIDNMKDELGNPVYHIQYRVVMTVFPAEKQGG